TESMGGDPDKWSDVERHLPLLAKRKYYQHTRHGYARGWEPVAYVQHIRQYYNILRWQEEQNHRRVAVTDVEQLYPPIASVPAARVSLSQSASSTDLPPCSGFFPRDGAGKSRTCAPPPLRQASLAGSER